MRHLPASIHPLTGAAEHGKRRRPHPWSILHSSCQLLNHNQWMQRFDLRCFKTTTVRKKETAQGRCFHNEIAWQYEENGSGAQEDRRLLKVGLTLVIVSSSEIWARSSQM